MSEALTYTVFSSSDLGHATPGLTLAEAADALMSTDGYAWEWRTEKRDVSGYRRPQEYFVIWVSDGSANSPRGARNMKKSRFMGFDQNDVLLDVLRVQWRGMETLLDADFQAMAAAALAEIEALEE